MLGLRGISKRAAFVVDKEGVIQYVEILDDARELPDFGALKDTLEAM
ncbi:hypothetical protein GCM10027291_52760 [Telluribacter humicola]|nr:hypothetical protein [Telluribacter humicola]